MYSEIVREPQFYLDNGCKFFPEATAFILTGNNLDYLIALLHTKCITYCFKTFYAGGGLGEEGYRYKKAFLVNLPIPKFKNTELQSEIIHLVQQRIQGENTDEQINHKVYELYGLSKEEIELIEKN